MIYSLGIAFVVRIYLKGVEIRDHRLDSNLRPPQPGLSLRTQQPKHFVFDVCFTLSLCRGSRGPFSLQLGFLDECRNIL